MTKRTALTLTLSVTIPLPPGHKAKDAIEEVEQLLEHSELFRSFYTAIIVKVLERKTSYL